MVNVTTAATPFTNVMGVPDPNGTVALSLSTTDGSWPLTACVAPEKVSDLAPVYAVSVFPFASWAVIVRSCAVPAVWEADPVTTSLVALPGTPVAVNVNGDPVRPVEVAVIVFAPAVVPSVHVGDVAMPKAFVVTVAGVASDPPPLVTAKVTEVPETRLPTVSVTRTNGAVVTAVPTVAL